MRCDPNGADDPAGVLTAQTTRGFTGHEMIDGEAAPRQRSNRAISDLRPNDLVNMNGRVYDPQIGRFLSPDPFIQDVTNTQNLNRYTYVNNNPLSYTDPSGYFFKKLFRAIGRFFKRFWRPLLAIAVSFILQQYYLPGIFESLGVTNAAIATPLTAGISGGVSNVILTGRPKGFLAGFGQSIVTYGIRGAFQGSQGIKIFGKNVQVGKAVAHGVIGGGFDRIRGGTFKSGFLAAGFSSLTGDLYQTRSRVLGTAYSAVVGGTASVLGGGKFANGAVTAAFVYQFNHGYHPTDAEIAAAERELAQAKESLAKINEYVYNHGYRGDKGILLSQQDAVDLVRQREARVRYLHAQRARVMRDHVDGAYDGDNLGPNAEYVCGIAGTVACSPAGKASAICGVGAATACEVYDRLDFPPRYPEDLPPEERSDQ